LARVPQQNTGGGTSDLEVAADAGQDVAGYRGFLKLARCCRSFAGRPDEVPRVRKFVALVLRDFTAATDVVLMAGELATNAVQHSQSGQPGGRFSVLVETGDPGWIWLGVQDAGGPTPPRLRSPAAAGGLEGGRGLQIVDGLASAWGVTGDVAGRTVWFRVS